MVRGSGSKVAAADYTVSMTSCATSSADVRPTIGSGDIGEPPRVAAVQHCDSAVATDDKVTHELLVCCVVIRLSRLSGGHQLKRSWRNGTGAGLDLEAEIVHEQRHSRNGGRWRRVVR